MKHASLAIGALAALASFAAAPASANGELFVQEVLLTPDQVARRAPPPADPAAMERAMIDLVMSEGNRQRALAGLGPLREDAALTEAARRYSRRMRDERFFDHVAPNGEGLESRLPDHERWRFAKVGENLWSAEGALDWRAAGLARQAAENWIESPSHRDNLLEPSYTLAGVGAAIGGDRIYVTMLYALPHADQRMARLRYEHGEPPADTTGLARSMAAAALEAINAERARRALPPLRANDALRRAAQDHLSGAGQTGHDALRRVLRSAADPMNRVAMAMWGASGALVWRGDALAETMLDSWRESGSGWLDALDPEFSEAGVGVAVEGDRVRAALVFGAKAPLDTASIGGDGGGGAVYHVGPDPLQGRVDGARVIVID